jgi:hypothetical protein
MRAALLVGLLLSVHLAACGGNAVVGAHSSTTGAAGATSNTTATGAGGGCITPTVGEACSSGEVACQPADPCCTGYEWACPAGTWQQEGLGCSCKMPTPFACGTTTCSAGFFCEQHPPGIAPPPDAGVPVGSYTCSPLPASCASSPTCACLGAALGDGDPCSPSFGAMCEVDGAGNVTIVCIDA